MRATYEPPQPTLVLLVPEGLSVPAAVRVEGVDISRKHAFEKQILPEFPSLRVSHGNPEQYLIKLRIFLEKVRRLMGTGSRTSLRLRIPDPYEPYLRSGNVLMPLHEPLIKSLRASWQALLHVPLKGVRIQFAVERGFFCS